MPSKPPHPCAHTGCPALIPAGERYCAEHAKAAPRHRAYDRGRESSSRRGYGAQWRRVRDYVLNLHPGCARCDAPAVEVHHIQHVDKGGALYELSNLEPLCHRCHMREHGEA